MALIHEAAAAAATAVADMLPPGYSGVEAAHMLDAVWALNAFIQKVAASARPATQVMTATTAASTNPRSWTLLSDPPVFLAAQQPNTDAAPREV
jgi:hypothetical protein